MWGIYVKYQQETVVGYQLVMLFFLSVAATIVAELIYHRCELSSGYTFQ